MAFVRTELAVDALFKALDRERVSPQRAEVATELVLALQEWSRAANTVRYEALFELHERGWSVAELRERFHIPQAEPATPGLPSVADSDT